MKGIIWRKVQENAYQPPSIKRNTVVDDQEISKEQMDQILDALVAGRKIEAIKVYREATGCDLKNAKGSIDRLVAELNHDGSVPSRNPVVHFSTNFFVGVGYVVVALAVLGVLAYTWMNILS